MIWLNFVIRCLLFFGNEKFTNYTIREILYENLVTVGSGGFPAQGYYSEQQDMFLIFKQYSNSTFSIEMKFEIGYKQYTIAKRNGFNDWQVIYNSRENWK